MGGQADFRTYGSVEEAEKRLRQETLAEHAHALNNHADSLVALNKHHEEMHKAVARLNDQMDAVLDSLTQINKRLDILESLGVLAEDLRQTQISEALKRREGSRG